MQFKNNRFYNISQGFKAQNQEKQKKGKKEFINFRRFVIYV